MQLSVYVAGSFLEKVLVHDLILKLRRLGYHVSYDWTKHKPTTDVARLRIEARKDHGGIEVAHVFILLWPGRYSAATEFGIALTLEKPIIIYDPDIRFNYEHNLFFVDPSVEVVHTMDALDLALRDIEEELRNNGQRVGARAPWMAVSERTL